MLRYKYGKPAKLSRDANDSSKEGGKRDDYGLFFSDDM